jgi:hypothetical protein
LTTVTRRKPLAKEKNYEKRLINFQAILPARLEPEQNHQQARASPEKSEKRYGELRARFLLAKAS